MATVKFTDNYLKSLKPKEYQKWTLIFGQPLKCILPSHAVA